MAKIIKGYLDTGTTQAILTDLNYFTNWIEMDLPLSQLDKSADAIGKAIGDSYISINENLLCLHNAIWVPNGSSNLFSDLDFMSGTGWRVDGGPEGYNFYDPSTNEIKMRCKRGKNRLIKIEVELAKVKFAKRTGFVVKPLLYDHKTVHSVFGHMSKSYVKRFVNGTTLDLNFHEFEIDDDLQCECCHTGKFRRAPYTKDFISEVSTKGPGELLHMDLSGEMSPPYAKGGKMYKYFMVIVDDFSRYTWVRLLESKNQALECAIEIIVLLERQYDFTVKRFRFDNGELSSLATQTLTQMHGIALDAHVSRSSEENGVAESAVKNIKNIARPMLHNTYLSGMFWGPAVELAAELKNVWPHSKIDYSSPWERLNGLKPRVTHYRTFGCKVLVPQYTTQRTDGSLETKSIEKIYLRPHSPKIFIAIDATTGRYSYHRFKDAEFFVDEYPTYKGESRSTFEERVAAELHEPITARNRAIRALHRHRTRSEILDSTELSRTTTLGEKVPAPRVHIFYIVHGIDHSIGRT